MKTILDIGIFISLILSTILHLFLLFSMKETLDCIHHVNNLQGHILDEQHEIKHKIHRIDNTSDYTSKQMEYIISEINRINQNLSSMQTLEDTTPMKTNNWDSINKAFSRYSRTDLDERD